MSSSSSFRFLDLPNELRLKMYRFMLPHGERLFLDPERVQFPIPYTVEKYDSTFNILQVCKKIHVEATQFMYRHCTVNVIATKDKGNFLKGLGSIACQFITKLECHVTHGLADLGNIWKTLVECPLLTNLRLVFYHEARNWSKTLAQLARYRQKNEKDGCHFRLDIELHNSIWARHYYSFDYATQFGSYLTRADRHAGVYSFTIPSQLRHITLSASVTNSAATEFEQWNDRSGKWGWVRAEVPDDTEQRHTLRFSKVTEQVEPQALPA